MSPENSTRRLLKSLGRLNISVNRNDYYDLVLHELGNDHESRINLAIKSATLIQNSLRFYEKFRSLKC